MVIPRILVFALVGAVIGGVRGWIWHRDRLERQRRAPPVPRALPPVSIVSPSLAGPAWGWVWFHAAASGARGLGYFYVDSCHGPSLRVFADLRAEPDEDTLRAEILARLPSGGVPQQVAAFKVVSGDGPTEGAEARSLFEAGRDREGRYGTILLRVSAAERALFGIPERPTFVDSLF